MPSLTLTLHVEWGCSARLMGRAYGVGWIHVVDELVAGVEARTVKPVVGPESHTEELSVGLNFEVLELAAVPWVLAVPRHEVGELHVVAGRGRFTPADSMLHETARLFVCYSKYTNIQRNRRIKQNTWWWLTFFNTSKRCTLFNIQMYDKPIL